MAHPSIDERKAAGLETRDKVPVSSHTKWGPAADRADPVALLEEQDATREPDLVPVRHGRMMVSPFTFYRGAAKIMAADLKDTPVAGLGAQLCGDAHLSNFGAFASPERRLLFDLNDFDETLPGPFEYDVKRMAASFTIAASNNGFVTADTRGYKEATASVLEPSVRQSRYRQHGERVVQGQRMMQAASDIYLGWTKGLDVRRHFYWRQLRDMKGSAVVEAMTPLALTFYARICGWTLARAHARSGDPIAIAEYLGASDAFDKSITDFSQRYADQNERDYQQFVTAIRSGRLEAVEGV
jgi:uncharacterized protein (DUF2252 family)